ncbi:phosphatidylglycerol:prolipoprotein diacylglycerol transferase [Novosphingobium chloroacetimidivorans]|uniref:Phosphatidylglycerol--prolipoprotein diacylglyceryl transferase n=1 Tax=Novosphingobium chloroacetimidivorans TaxID=1428314 RepID=A0A7W7NXE1_9SPHN|nr:prolipoprotein diacylglyceryl transferase [Novosphingobium chloroacetimidivorans]MBB4859369.1 phosphatidylglycerol:prolipoprotein diacylglycerol transferase [Novosphingobium chloroacetimidivorans]
MLIPSAAAAATTSIGAHEPIYWVNLGLKNGIDLGFFTLRYYSLAYLAGIVLGYWHLGRMIKAPGAPMAQRHADDLFFYCTLGIILGGRLGYATFYTGGDTGIPSLWLHPSELLALWHGGMSFHGGLIGVVLAMAWVSWRADLNFIRVADYIAVCVPFGMLFGRLANFVNGELWGRVAGPDVPWAMVFPDAGPLPRHPSQLYEAALEGALLIVIMLLLYWKTRARYRPGLMVGVFSTGIALARFSVEFFREPDAQLQSFAMRTGLSMGQWLTIPLMILGLAMVARALVKPPLAGRRPVIT